MFIWLCCYPEDQLEVSLSTLDKSIKSECLGLYELWMFSCVTALVSTSARLVEGGRSANLCSCRWVWAGWSRGCSVLEWALIANSVSFPDCCYRWFLFNNSFFLKKILKSYKMMKNFKDQPLPTLLQKIKFKDDPAKHSRINLYLRCQKAGLCLY